jgi:hypothetical protein
MPDPIAEDDSLDEILRPFSIHRSKYKTGIGTVARKQLNKKLEVYTTNKIIEELERLPIHDYGDTGSYEAYVVIRDRLAELKVLNHRKDK